MAVAQTGPDPTIVVAISGAVAVIATGLITAWTARRGAKADAKRQQQEAGFTQAFDLAKYIREEVAKGIADATKPLREESDKQRSELDAMKKVVGSLYGRITRMRDAVREFVHDWRAAWGKQDTPPPLSQHIRELLEDEQDFDYDTLTAAQIKQIIAPESAD
ncbi:hypothetical protein ABC270_13325 [Curtobacterium sp. 1P10AnD]|uniref:hypothetical protein n=1 Tax=Curtobacterium sp. 1P10AnD TaxID=3132283 RepID=UPI0039A03659